MNIRESEALRCINTSDENCYSIQREYEEYIRREQFLDEDKRIDEKNRIASNMAKTIELYIKGLILHGMKIKIPDDALDMRNVLTSAGITDTELSPEEQHLIITGMDKEIREALTARDTRNKYPRLAALLADDKRNNREKNGHLQAILDAAKPIRFFTIGHDLKAGLAALSGAGQVYDERFIENSIDRSIFNNIYQDFNYKKLETFSKDVMKLSPIGDEDLEIDFKNSDEMQIKKFQNIMEEKDNISDLTDPVTTLEVLLAYSVPDEVRSAFQNGRYGMISNSDGTHYVADIDTLYMVMISLNQSISRIWTEAIGVKSGDENSIAYNILPDSGTKVLVRDSTGEELQELDCTFSGRIKVGERKEAEIISGVPGQIIDYVENGEHKRVVCLKDSVLSIRYTEDIDTEAIERLCGLQDSPDELSKRAEELEAENSELTEQVTGLQEMLGKALSFIERVRNSRFGSFWFRRDLKGLPDSNDNQDESR